jgi:hypothetical protein
MTSTPDRFRMREHPDRGLSRQSGGEQRPAVMPDRPPTAACTTTTHGKGADDDAER